MVSRRLPTALFALAMLLPTAARAGDPVGFVAAVRGLAEMRGSEGGFFVAAIDRDVALGDVVRTREGGWLKMLLADDTILAVDAASELRVDRFAGRDGAKATGLTLGAGHVRAKLIDGFGRRAHLQLTTPHALVVARGTEWLTWIDADATWVCAVSGIVAVQAGDSSLEVGPGDCARAGSQVTKASRPRHLRAVAMRPGAVQDRPSFPAKPAGVDLAEPDRLVIDPNDLLRPRVREDLGDGRPPASAAVP